MASKPLVNVADVPLMDRGHGERFSVRWGRIGPAIGLTNLGCALHVVPPGKRAFPFHAHHVADELFFILSGTGEYRFGDQSFSVRDGNPKSASFAHLGRAGETLDYWDGETA